MKKFRLWRLGKQSRRPIDADASLPNASISASSTPSAPFSEDSKIKGRLRLGEIALSPGALSLRDIDLGLEFTLPKAPEQKVKTRLRELDGWLGLRTRAWWNGKRQKPPTNAAELDEAQREAINEKARYDVQLDRAVGEVAEGLSAEIVARIPPHYTKELVNEYVAAHWKARQAACFPQGKAIARGVIETGDALRAFRNQHDLQDAVPEDAKPERLGPTFFLVFLGEAALNAFFYREAFPSSNMTTSLGLAVVVSLWIMLAGVANGALGIANLRSKDDYLRRVARIACISATCVGVGSALMFGLLRLLIIGVSPPEEQLLHRFEALLLALLNIMAFCYVSYKFRNGLSDLPFQFERLWNAHHRAERHLDTFLARRARAHMDTVLSHYRDEFLYLKHQLKRAHSPVIRALAAFETIENNARALQCTAARDTIELVKSYRERNREARRVFSFIGWLTRLKKTPPPDYFDDTIDASTEFDPLPSRTHTVRDAAARFEQDIKIIEASVDDILIDLGTLTSTINGNFDEYRRMLLSAARASVSEVKGGALALEGAHV
ncbi:hypothetical protein [Vitreimonas sp.]|uniref:hypothetical protein n=1 Tax=Vitreimonas sp. TaxID=3069702 RepID=UPI002EDA7A7B